MLLIGFPDLQKFVQSICQPQRRLQLDHSIFSICLIFHIDQLIDRTGILDGGWSSPLVKNVPESEASGFQIFLQKNCVGLFNLKEGFMSKIDQYGHSVTAKV